MLIKVNDHIFIQTDNITAVIDSGNIGGIKIKHNATNGQYFVSSTEFYGQDRLDVLKALNEYVSNQVGD